MAAQDLHRNLAPGTVMPGSRRLPGTQGLQHYEPVVDEAVVLVLCARSRKNSHNLWARFRMRANNHFREGTKMVVNVANNMCSPNSGLCITSCFSVYSHHRDRNTTIMRLLASFRPQKRPTGCWWGIKKSHGVRGTIG